MKVCPCGSRTSFESCCQPYLDGTAAAPTPEALMRSRYTAFTRGDRAYLARTWHPATVPPLDRDEPQSWVGLEIVRASGTEVEFVAKLVVGDQLAVLHEVSSFEALDGRWVYRSGTFKNERTPPRRLTMKEPCPCGSGKKFKHCHFEAL